MLRISSMDQELIMAKSLYQQLIEIYPELENSEELIKNVVYLRNDSDGTGDYIAKWEYSKPIPDSLKSYDRT
jgi:hypothetical protein